MRKTILALVFFLALMILLVYTRPLSTASANKNQCIPGGPLSPCNPDGQKSYEEFHATIKSFRYSAPAERKERLLKNYASLRVGMTKNEVSALIGDPDYSEIAFGPKGPGEHWLGSDWNYVLFKEEDVTTSIGIFISFGTDGLLRWAAPSRLPQFSEIGSCCKQAQNDTNK